MPSRSEIEAWIQRNDAVRVADGWMLGAGSAGQLCVERRLTPVAA